MVRVFPDGSGAPANVWVATDAQADSVVDAHLVAHAAVEPGLVNLHLWGRRGRAFAGDREVLAPRLAEVLPDMLGGGFSYRVVAGEAAALGRGGFVAELSTALGTPAVGFAATVWLHPVTGAVITSGMSTDGGLVPRPEVDQHGHPVGEVWHYEPGNEPTPYPSPQPERIDPADHWLPAIATPRTSTRITTAPMPDRGDTVRTPVSSSPPQATNPVSPSKAHPATIADGVPVYEPVKAAPGYDEAPAALDTGTF